MRAMFVILFAAACGRSHDRSQHRSQEDDCGQPFFLDEDGDGYGVAGQSIEQCTAPAGYVTTDDDCDDADATINPDATETCNGVDDDCDGKVDAHASDAPTWYTDVDADGFGDPDRGIVACAQLAGTVADATDCDDASASIHPGATETCNSLDNDCDGVEDDSDPDVIKVQLFLDGDGDGYGVDSDAVYGCEAGYAPASGDCDDATATTFPGATENCANGVDDDCDSRIDDCWHSIDSADVFLTGTSGWFAVGDFVETGDVNADGVADLIATAANLIAFPDDWHTAQAQAYVVFGPMTADRNRDAADAAFFNNPPTAGIWVPVASADANGDGNDDILFSSVGDTHGYLLLGPVTSDASVSDADLILVGPNASGVVAILGDHDGDGGPDIAARSFDYGVVRRGTVYVGSGSATGTADLPSDATYTYDNFDGDEVGASIVSLGDATGDGIDDLAIGDPSPENHAVYVLAGGEPPGTYSLRGAPIATLKSVAEDRFGEAIAVTDYDSDGYVDILVGAQKETSVRAFFGPFASEREAVSSDVQWTGVRGIGHSIAADGDVDADGQADVLFGTPYAGDTAGAAYLQIGTATGVVDVADLVAFTSSSCMGSGVAFVPDWTGDGASEVALGNACFQPVGRVGVFFSEGL